MPLLEREEAEDIEMTGGNDIFWLYVAVAAMIGFLTSSLLRRWRSNDNNDDDAFGAIPSVLDFSREFFFADWW